MYLTTLFNWRCFMKKFLLWNLAAFAALALVLGSTTKADAIELGCYETGFVVPVAFHNASDVDTVVSIINTCQCGTKATDPCTVYWTFFSKDSDHLYDSSLKLTKDDLGSFSLMEALGCNLVGEEGYLVFTLGGADGSIIDQDCIAANAYIIDVTNNDAIFIPVLPLDIEDYVRDLNLTAMDADSVTGASYGMDGNATVDLRYWVDRAYEARTTLAVWTIKNNIGPATVNVYDDEEHRTSLTICWKYTELNLWDPTCTGATASSKCNSSGRDGAADFTAWPSSYLDGFLRLDIPAPGIAWSWINTATIGAAQTFLGSEFCGVVDALGDPCPACTCP
jgi:hypothetical protein